MKGRAHDLVVEITWNEETACSLWWSDRLSDKWKCYLIPQALSFYSPGMLLFLESRPPKQVHSGGLLARKNKAKQKWNTHTNWKGPWPRGCGALVMENGHSPHFECSLGSLAGERVERLKKALVRPTPTHFLCPAVSSASTSCAVYDTREWGQTFSPFQAHLITDRGRDENVWSCPLVIDALEKWQDCGSKCFEEARFREGLDHPLDMENAASHLFIATSRWEP